MAKEKAGSSGIDRVTFEDIEEIGVTKYLKEIREELVNRTYKPQINRKQEIPKENGKVRVLGIPTIKDRIVQGALKLILEPIFEADFQEGSYGYRPKRNAHQAVKKIEKAIITGKRKVIDLDLSNYFDTVKHHILLAKVGKRVIDKDIMHLIKLILKASGKEGVPQGGVISPLFANFYLNEVDKMLERATEVTKSKGRYTEVEYARFADDIVIAVSSHYSMNWLLPKVMKRLKEEFNKIQVKINKEKTKIVNLEEGDSRNCFSYIRDYVEKKVRRYLMKQRGKQGYGWKRWSSDWLYNKVGLFNDYKVAYYQP
nr:reverse transcriptase domain-containing protein [Halobacteroides halobius]